MWGLHTSKQILQIVAPKTFFKIYSFYKYVKFRNLFKKMSKY